MVLPLYDLSRKEQPELKKMGNAGLWFDRFFNGYLRKKEKKTSDQKLVISEDDRSEWLNDLVTTINPRKDKTDKESVEERNQILEKKALRQMNLVKSLHGSVQIYTSEWHFVTGMGLPHPIENGFLWHPTLGVPYFPGAAIKGMVRSYLEVWHNKDERLKARLLKWFGSDDKEPLKQESQSQSGCLIFFDALPMSSVKLGIDIMTPHMGDWYAKGNQIQNIQGESEKIPADWHDPVPIKYLVAEKAQFLFSIAPRKKSDAIEVKEAMNVLDSSLKWIGAGAKTAIGYGFFSDDEEATKKIRNKQEEAVLKNLPPHERIPKEIEKMDVAMLPDLLGKNKNKTLKSWGADQDFYLKAIKDVFGDLIKKWEHSEKANERKVYRLIYPEKIH